MTLAQAVEEAEVDLLEHQGACRRSFEDSPEDTWKVLIVGEDNPQSSALEHALYPYPPGCAGHRLCHNIFGVRRSTHLAMWRTNLCNPTWKMRDARERAEQLAHTMVAPWRTIILLGAKVTEAFAECTGGRLALFTSKKIRIDFSLYTNTVRTFVALPHPSGRNLIWNDPNQALKARALLREVAPGIPWGEALVEESA